MSANRPSFSGTDLLLPIIVFCDSARPTVPVQHAYLQQGIHHNYNFDCYVVNAYCIQVGIASVSLLPTTSGSPNVTIYIKAPKQKICLPHQASTFKLGKAYAKASRALQRWDGIHRFVYVTLNPFCRRKLQSESFLADIWKVMFNTWILKFMRLVH